MQKMLLLLYFYTRPKLFFVFKIITLVKSPCDKKSQNQNKTQRTNPRHQGNKSEGLIHISEFQAL